MNGYIKNKSVGWKHAMKRAVGPGGKVSLDTLYEQYGEKHDLKEGKEFVNWLKTVKLRNRDLWEVIFNEDSIEQQEDIEETPIPVVEPIKDVMSEDDATIQEIKKMTVKDIVGLSVRKGREVLPHVVDSNLLKYALQEANQMTGKDSLCRIIRKRLDQMLLAI